MRCWTLFIGVSFIAYFGLHAGYAGQQAVAQRMSLAELQSCVGGVCPDIGCQQAGCGTGGGNPCPQWNQDFCTPVGNQKCGRLALTPYARCGAAKQGYDCTEASTTGCVKKYTGDQPAGQQNCPETACNSLSGTCGDVAYQCSESACPL